MDRRIGEQIPQLTTLVLTANAVREMGDVEGLRGCARLTHLSLLENPVTRKEVGVSSFIQTVLDAGVDLLQHYRSYMIWLIPSLRFLDFQRIRDVERKQATELLGTAESPSELAASIRGVKSKTFDVSGAGVNGRGGAAKGMRTQMTASEKQRVQELIKNARSLAEIAKIEKDLAEGRIPAGAADADRMVS